MDGTEFENLLQAPSPELTPLDNNRGRDANEPIAADDGEELVSTDEDNESVVSNENMFAGLDDTIYVEQLRNDNVDVEVNILAIDQVVAQEGVIIEDDDGGKVNFDMIPDNILPEGPRRGKIPRRRLAEEGYQLANMTDSVNDTPQATNDYLNGMTVYAESHSAFAQAGNLFQVAAEHLLLTQLMMKAGINAFE